MTADYTIEATPGQVAAIERDGFLVVAGPSDTCYLCVGSGVADGWEGEAIECAHCDGTGRVPVPPSKPCPECDGLVGCPWYQHTERGQPLPDPWNGCGGCVSEPACYTDGPHDCCERGVVPIVVEVVVGERECPECGGYGGRWHTDTETIVHRPADGEVGEFTIRMDSQNTVTIVGHADDEGHGYLFCDRCKTKGTVPARTLLRGTAEAVPVVDERGWLHDSDTPESALVLELYGSVALISGRVDADVTHHFADVPRPEVGDTAWITRGEGS